MTREFLEAPISKRPGAEITSPYLAARMEWDERYGNLSAQAANWRRGFFLLGLLFLGLLGACYYLISLPKHIPIVVTLDKTKGEPEVLGKVDTSKVDVSLPEVRYFLSLFIQKVRAVPQDPVLIKKQWLEAYAFLRRGAANYLNSLTQEDSSTALKQIGKKTVTVQPISVVQVAGESSYQARWRELVYSDTGALESQYTMTGVFTIEIEPPSDEKTILINPLGIFIESFQWSKEL